VRKKQKTMEELLEEALVPEKEQPYEVPGNWVWTKLGKIANYHNGKAFKPTDWSDKGRPIIRIQDLTGTNKGEPHFFEGQIDKKHEIKSGDLLISWSATLGAYIWKGEEAVLNQHIFKVESFINKKYHYYLMQNLISSLYSKTHGSGMVHVTKKVFDEIPVPLPNLKEQKRIADKVEHLLSKIDEAKRLIEEAKETFELRRAAILDKAFRGELTRKWREENHLNSTATQLLAKISKLKPEKKSKFKDQLDPGILEHLFNLPNEWKWVRLNDLTEEFTYGTSAKTNDDSSGTPVIRMGNIIDGYLDLKDLKYLPNNHEDVIKFDLDTNDILFNRTNSYELVGKTAVVTSEILNKMTFASYLIRVRLLLKNILAGYVSHFINSHIGRKILLTMVTQQVGQANINSQKLASLPIPLPPEEEIIEITQRINKYIEREREQKEKLSLEEDIITLKQSILSKAFRGELGTNDPTEESAIELLKEVLQEQVK